MKTNKYLYRVSLMMGFAALFTLSSCGDDDDSTEVYKNTKPMRVSKVTESRQNSSDTQTYNFIYDSQGRIVSHGGSIDFKYSGDGNSVTRVNSKSETSHTYDLKNGNIIREEEKTREVNITLDFEYDSDGYLSAKTRKIIVYVGSGDIRQDFYIYTWENGNLTKCTYFEGGTLLSTVRISYSNIPWPQNWFPNLMIYADTYLADLFSYPGKLGKTPKYLPSKFESFDESGIHDEIHDLYTCTLDYTIKDGLLTKVTLTPVGWTYPNPRYFDIEWEEIPAK